MNDQKSQNLSRQAWIIFSSLLMRILEDRDMMSFCTWSTWRNMQKFEVSIDLITYKVDNI